MQKFSSVQDLENNRDLWLKSLQEGNEQVLRPLYKLYRVDFVRWIQSKTSCKEDEALDVFQDSIVALYHNVQKGTLTSFEKGIRSYLFTIGKYIYFRRSSKKKQIKTTSFENADLKPSNLIDTPTENSLQHDQQKLILALLQRMKEPCKSILNLFYYENKSMKEIAQQLKYGSPGVVKVQKLRCMNRLKAAAAKFKKK